jgi:hypothetical protein
MEWPMKLRLLCGSVLLVLTLSPAALSKRITAPDGLEPETHDQVVAEVTRLGGKVELDETAPGKPIVKIDLHGTKITDGDLAFLNRSGLQELRYLDLRLTQIGDAGAVHLKNLTGLQTLNLFRTQVGDRGLRQLRKLTKLQTLLIGGTKITDDGLVNLKSMKQVKKLSLFQTKVTDAAIPHLKILPQLESLLISGTKITDAGTKELLRALPRLQFGETT